MDDSRRRDTVDSSRPVGGRGLTLAWFWPMGIVAAVLYASLLPFDVNWAVFKPANAFGFSAIRWADTSREDIAANLLVYIPVGLALALSLARKRPVSWIHGFVAVLLGTLVSAAAETLQGGITARVASWTDVALNATGTAIGTLLAAILDCVTRIGLVRWRRRINEQPFATASLLLAVGLLLYNLSPFDLVTDTATLHASFGRARLGLVDSRAGAADAAPWAGVTGQLSAAGWFGLLGYLFGLAGREARRPHAESLVSTLRDGLILVVLIELMQVFTQSHVFDPAVMMLRTVGVAFGGWCSLFVVDRFTGSSWRRRPGLAIPSLFLALLAALQVSLLFLASMDAGGWSLGGLSLSGTPALPFEQLWRQRVNVAAHDMLSTLVTYATLAITLAVLLRRGRVAYARLAAGMGVTLLAIGLEVLKSAGPPHSMDFTGALLAVLSAVGVATVYPELRRSPVQSTRGPDAAAG